MQGSVIKVALLGERMRKVIGTLLLLLVVVGCSKPLPQDRVDYVGEWQSKEMYLLILADGSVEYKRVKKGATTSVSGPLKEFVGDDFNVGVLFFTTTFNVSEAPHETGGNWEMTVDGVRLVRSKD